MDRIGAEKHGDCRQSKHAANGKGVRRDFDTLIHETQYRVSGNRDARRESDALQRRETRSPSEKQAGDEKQGNREQKRERELEPHG